MCILYILYWCQPIQSLPNAVWMRWRPLLSRVCCWAWCPLVPPPLLVCAVPPVLLGAVPPLLLCGASPLLVFAVPPLTPPLLLL